MHNYLDDDENEEQQTFDIFAIARIVDRAYSQFEPDLEKVQEQCQKRLRLMGLEVDLEETKKRHESRIFHKNAEIVAVMDDGMQFIRYCGKWIIGAESTGYFCLKVNSDNIEVFNNKGEVEIKKA